MIYWDLNSDSMGYEWDIASGKHTKNYEKIHQAINGFISTISTGPWLQVRKLLVITRGYIPLISH